MLFFTFFIFVFGIIIGSFLNVVALRWKSGLTLSGRSFCFVCQKKIKWFDLIPVCSFLFLKGRCRNCKVPISWQYPLVEFFTGVLFASTFIFLSKSFSGLFLFINLSYYFIVWSVLIVIFIYDVKHKIIPNTLSYCFFILSMFVPISQYFFSNNDFLFINILSGPILFLFFFLFWFLSSGRFMGFGDAKLALGIGTLLGFVGGISAVVLAFWIGAIISIIIMVVQKFNKNKLSSKDKQLTMKSEVPFAPFLIVGLILVFFFNFDPLKISDLLNFL